MRTDWNGRQRPHLEIIDWYPSEKDRAKIEAAPTQPKTLPPALENAPEKAPEQAPEQAPKPTLAEEMKDELPF
jgi:hypothetical protein